MSEKRKVKPVPLFLDNPVDVDTLGVEQLAYTIAGAAIGNPGPFTIGVFGGWGKGKTSVLRITRELLRNKDTFDGVAATIWFNAWQHEREDHPLFSLIAAIVDGLERESELLNSDLGKDGQPTLKGKTKKQFRKAALSLRALTRGMKFTGKVQMPLVGEVGVEFDANKALVAEDLLGKQNHPLLGELLYHKAFEGLGEVTKGFSTNSEESGAHANIVVFIDDLDRCNPSKALHILEGIKLILSQPGFVFVLAIDRDVIEKYLEFLYENEYKIGKGRGAKYLDKMVQLSLSLPNHRDSIQNHLDQLLENFVARAKGFAEYDLVIEVIQKSQNAILSGVDGNPRNLVRLLNGFFVDCQLWTTVGDMSLDKVAGSLIFHRLLEGRVGDVLLDQLVDSQGFWDDMALSNYDTHLDDVEAGKKVRLLGLGQAKREVSLILYQSPELSDLIKGQANLYATRQDVRHVIRKMSIGRSSLLPENVLSPAVIEALKSSAMIAPSEEATWESLTRARKINFDDIELKDTEIEHIISNILSATGISMMGSLISKRGIGLFLEKIKNLEFLYLDKTVADDDTVSQIVENAEKLVSLSMDMTKITDSSLFYLAESHLQLEGFYASKADFSNAAAAFFLERQLKLQFLDLSHIGLGDSVIEVAARSLEQLEYLNMNGSKLTDSCIELVKGRFKKLRVLYIVDAGLSETVIENIRKELKNTRVIA